MKMQLTKRTLISSITIASIAVLFATLIATPLLLSSPAKALGIAGPMTMTFADIS